MCEEARLLALDISSTATTFVKLIREKTVKSERKLKQCLGTGQAETLLACGPVSDTHCKYTQILFKYNMHHLYGCQYPD